MLFSTHPKNYARVMKMTTAHGDFMTPTFMPVATRAAVNCLTTEALHTSGSQIILGGNTYHMLCAPGMEVIRAAGGMHRFMNWSGPMLTDSGGFQIFSLSKNSNICRIHEEGARFKHPETGQLIEMTPESSLETQKIIGADIIMAFDQCTPDATDKDSVVTAMRRTHRWLLRSKAYHDKNPTSIYGYPQALFGIIQGGAYRDLREESAAYVTSLGLDGIAIGGETIGYDMKKTVEILGWLQSHLPADKIRYAMGVGLSPQDLLDVVAQGVDIFDCVAPTRNARHGTLYCGRIISTGDWLRFHGEGENGRDKILIKKSIYAQDQNPISHDCGCFTCQKYSRSYLHYLFKQKLALYSVLACHHNLYVMHEVCRKMRAFICIQ